MEKKKKFFLVMEQIGESFCDLFLVLIFILIIGMPLRAILFHQEETPLLRAVKEGDSQSCLAIIREGADVNAPDRFGKTPLALSIKEGKKEIFYLLVGEGADINKKAGIIVPSYKVLGTSVHLKEVTLLHVAVNSRRYEICKFLLEKGAQVDAGDADGKTANDYLENIPPEERGRFEDILIKAGANVGG